MCRLPCIEQSRIREQKPVGAHARLVGLAVRYPISRSNLINSFNDNPQKLLEAYVESGEGLDRAGGFAIQESESTYDSLSLRLKCYVQRAEF